MPTFNQKTTFGEVAERKLEDATILEITHRLFTASVSLYGGHVLTWQPQGQKPVFWLSETASYSENKAIRGGIPICWPWFGPNNANEQGSLPSHGFARNRHWQLTNVSLTEQNVELTLVLQGSHFLGNWEYAFEAVQTLVFSNTFSQSLVIKNTGEQAFECGHALHSYFAVSHPGNTRVEGLNNQLFDDKITGLLQQQDVLTNCVGPIDRIYYDNSPQIIQDTGWGRSIEVSSEYSNEWVLWNPGKEIADNMPDVHSDGENQYVCLEAANVNTTILAPNCQRSFSQHISVHQA